MKDISIVKGMSIYDFFIIPTIRINYRSYKYLTVEWLRWYIGITWD